MNEKNETQNTAELNAATEEKTGLEALLEQQKQAGTQPPPTQIKVEPQKKSKAPKYAAALVTAAAAAGLVAAAGKANIVGKIFEKIQENQLSGIFAVDIEENYQNLDGYTSERSNEP